MASIVLYYYGVYDRDIKKSLNQHSSHISSANHLFEFSWIIPNPLINEYLVVLIHTIIFGSLLYLALSMASYAFLFKFQKEKYLPLLSTKDFKIWHDIKWSLLNIFGEAFLVSLIRMAVPRYSFIYFDTNDWPIWIIPLSILFHVLWDETLTYWAHRFLHTYRFLYLNLHCIHHRSISITPFAGFAFHPLDAFLQALPTFTSCFLFPIHFNIFLFFSILTPCWAISIHDNLPALPCKLFLYATHHTIHHEKGKGSLKNFGKFTTVWDRMMGSYEDPDRIHYGWAGQNKRILFFSEFNRILSKVFDNRLVFDLYKKS